MFRKIRTATTHYTPMEWGTKVEGEKIVAWAHFVRTDIGALYSFYGDDADLHKHCGVSDQSGEDRAAGQDPRENGYLSDECDYGPCHASARQLFFREDIRRTGPECSYHKAASFHHHGFHSGPRDHGAVLP